MATALARTDLRLNALGMLLLLASFALPYQQGGGSITASTSEWFGVMVPEAFVLAIWMILSMALLWWKPKGWLPLGKLAADLPMALYSLWSIRFSSTFFDEPAFGALVGYTGVIVFLLGAIVGSVAAHRLARPSGKLDT